MGFRAAPSDQAFSLAGKILALPRLFSIPLMSACFGQDCQVFYPLTSQDPFLEHMKDDKKEKPYNILIVSIIVFMK